jgi:hypothetical protein
MWIVEHTATWLFTTTKAIALQGFRHAAEAFEVDHPFGMVRAAPGGSR